MTLLIRLLSVFCCLLIPSVRSAPGDSLFVSTLAGKKGSRGHADGSGETARFSYVSGISNDKDGNTLIADSTTIRKMDAAGNVTTIAGAYPNYGNRNGPAGTARFAEARAVVADSVGNIYVADDGNNQIRRIAPDGTVSLFAGTGDFGSNNGPRLASRFATPRGLAIGSDDTLYVADQANGLIRKIVGDNVTTLALTTEAGEPFKLQAPEGLVLDSSGRIFVADWRASSVYRINTDLTVTTLRTAPGANTTGVAVAADGTVFCSDTSTGRIWKISPSGQITQFAGRGMPNELETWPQLSSPRGLAWDPQGNLLVADSDNHCVRRIHSSGLISTLAGLTAGFADGFADEARFYVPAGVALDSSGDVLVSDRANQVIRRVTPTGDVSTFAGTPRRSGHQDGPATNAQFSSPAGLCVGSDGTIFVADSFNAVIRSISPSLRVETVAGVPLQTGHLDGAPNDARFNSPIALACDTDGTLYVCDSMNHAIRVIHPSDRHVSTLAGGAPSDFADGQGPAAKFNRPRGIALASDGSLIVADTFNYVVRSISLDGTVRTIAGRPKSSGMEDGPLATARFSSPSAVVVTPGGIIYVLDDSTLRRIKDGEVRTVAGKLAFPRILGGIDGFGPAAQFNSSNDGALAIGPHGSLIIADRSNHAIRLAEEPSLLRASKLPEGLRLSWANFTAIKLQQKSSLSPNQPWANQSGFRHENLGRTLYTNTANLSEAYFRLVQP